MLFGYIDPSSMTYLIQIVAAIVIAAGAGVGFYWKRIKRAVQKRKDERAGNAPAQPVETASGETFTADMLRDSAERKNDKAQ